MDHLRIYALYDSPKDVPGHIVVRATTVLPGGILKPDPGALAIPIAGDRELAVAAARTHCERLGLMRQDRHPDDDPTIIETWF